MRSPATYLFAGGGTGGHVYPAVAIAQELQRRDADAQIVFVGLADKIEARIASKYKYIFEAITITGFVRALSFRNVTTLIKAYVAIARSKKLMKKYAPACVIGTGGYVSGPVLYAAAAKKIPSLIHEQNTVPGLTTRMLANKMNYVCLTHDETMQYLKPQVRSVVTGNPVRSGLQSVSKEDARSAFKLENNLATVLVFGGSHGASAINKAVSEMVAKLVHRNVQVIWQTGRKDNAKYADQYATFKNVRVLNYIDDMNYAYAAADLVVCRAGATTISELTYLGKPSVLIPYPYATDNHQLKNAKTMEEAGCSQLIEEQNINQLYDVLLNILDNKDVLAEMSRCAKDKAMPDAAQIIVDLIHSIAA